MRKRQRGPRPVSDEPLSAGRVEYLEQARERVRNRRIRRTALIVVALTLVVPVSYTHLTLPTTILV